MIELDLSNNNISGIVPSQLDKLPNLTKLVLFNNSLQGPISDSLVNKFSIKEFIRNEVFCSNITRWFPHCSKSIQSKGFVFPARIILPILVFLPSFSLDLWLSLKFVLKVEKSNLMVLVSSPLEFE